MPRALPWIAFAAILCFFLARPAWADVIDDRAALYERYAGQLGELADWCDRHDLPQPAARLRAWLPKRNAEQLTLFCIADVDSEAVDETDHNAEWRRRWQMLRTAQSQALLNLARQAVGAGRASIALELVTEAVRENPDDKQGRRILGFVKYRDTWRTPFAIRQLGAGKVWHQRFGWLPQSHVARYEKGDRYYQGRWITAAEEAELRRDINRGWRVESDHYLVTTNHSLEEGVALSRRLETLHDVWQQAFAAYPAGEADLARRLEGHVSRRQARQHNVVYYRDRQEYNSMLRVAQPQIDITLGLYLDSTRTAYFFAGDQQEPGTLYHEATHQLFQETRAVAPDVGRRDNFWVVEGIACYMESLAQHDGYYTLGGANAGRMPAARHRLLTDGFYVPLARLVTIGMESLQRDSNIAPMYSQSAGLADFLMHDDRGRYRDALVRYLDAVYSGRATAQSLADLAGASYPDLDKEYRQFMAADEPAEAAVAPPAR